MKRPTKAGYYYVRKQPDELPTVVQVVPKGRVGYWFCLCPGLKLVFKKEEAEDWEWMGRAVLASDGQKEKHE